MTGKVPHFMDGGVREDRACHSVEKVIEHLLCVRHWAEHQGQG